MESDSSVYYSMIESDSSAMVNDSKDESTLEANQIDLSKFEKTLKNSKTPLLNSVLTRASLMAYSPKSAKKAALNSCSTPMFQNKENSVPNIDESGIKKVPFMLNDSPEEEAKTGKMGIFGKFSKF